VTSYRGVARQRTGLGALGLVCVLACSQADTSNTVIEAAAQQVAFGDLFDHVATVVPEQTADSYLVRPGQYAISSDGHIAIADPPEGNVKLYRADGSLRAVLGRKGEGPGELTEPRHVVFGPDSAVVVFDGGRRVVLEYSLDGKHVRETRLDVAVRGAAALGDGRYVVVGQAPRGDGQILHVLDEDFDLALSHLPIRDVRPEGEPDSDLWDFLVGWSVAAFAGQIFVTAQLADSLWVVDPDHGLERTYVLSFRDRVPMKLPSSAPTDMNELTEWAASMQLPWRPVATEGLYGVLYHRGHYEAPETVLVGKREGHWVFIPDSPMVVASNGDRIVVVANPGEADVRLEVFALRQ
jgi:hypothetical protein